MFRRLVLFLLVILAASPVVAQDTPEQPTPNLEIVGGDTASLNELLLRVVGIPLNSLGSEQVQLVVGALPDQLPFSLPLPDSANVIGALARSGQFGGTQVYFDTVLTEDEVFAFYEQALSGDEWQELPAQRGASGFVAPSQTSFTRCYRDEAALVVYAYPLGEQTAVGLYIQDDILYSPCSGAQTNTNSLIPLLQSPDGVRSTGGGSGVSATQQYVSSNLVTDLSVAELAAHYGEQLEAYGWERLSDEATESVASSTWRFTDEDGSDWSGVLAILNTGEASDERLALLQVAPQ
jgi:hypothetical protein